MDFYDLKEIPEHLKSYFEPAPQIGLEETPEQFIQKMVEVFHEVKRVTRDDGVLWLNLGDSYASNGVYIEKYKENHPEHVDLHTKNSERYQNLKGYRDDVIKAKDLMGIPWRVAFALQADGWYFRSAIPWIKRNCMPESTTDRPTSAIEYIFLMAKSARYFYDGEAIRRPASYSTDERKGRAQTDHKSMPTNERNGIRPKKQDQTGNPTYTGFNERWKEGTRRTRAGSNGQQIHPEGITHDLGDSATRNYRNSDPFFESWQGLYSESENPLAFIINPQARPELHFATFPDLLAATCIKAGTSEYGCCPACGTPYRRVVEYDEPSKISLSGKEQTEQNMKNGRFLSRRSTLPIGSAGNARANHTVGWQPGCSCNAGEPVPCIVLDPFMGSGTVAYVARELNRSSIGCELNPEYVAIIKKRLQVDSQLDTGVVSYRFEDVRP